MKSALAQEKIGEEAVRARTGKTWREWFKILDAAGARRMTHKEIAAYVHQRHPKIGGWWAQMVTAGYEQARGKRRKHEKPEGFEVSASKTIAASPASLYRVWTEAKLRRQWLPSAAFSITTATPNKSLRMKWEQGPSRMDVMFCGKGVEKTQVTVQHRRLPNAAAARRMQTYWKQQLANLKSLVERAASRSRIARPAERGALGRLGRLPGPLQQSLRPGSAPVRRQVQTS